MTGYNYSNVSLNEYPGHISLVISFRGCNFYCPYCFNPELTKFQQLSFKQVKDAIDEHIGFIDAVVLTGGEPLCHNTLPQIIKYCKSHGLKIKLNTNGFINLSSDNKYLQVDYLHISLKDPNYCIYPSGFIYDYLLSGKIIEYSFVYSPTLYPQSNLNEYVSKIKSSISESFFEGWDVPDIFTINQIQVGHCLDPQYNNVKIPTRDELKEVALLFKDIPCKKIMIETVSNGREIIYKR